MKGATTWKTVKAYELTQEDVGRRIKYVWHEPYEDWIDHIEGVLMGVDHFDRYHISVDVLQEREEDCEDHGDCYCRTDRSLFHHDCMISTGVAGLPEAHERGFDHDDSKRLHDAEIAAEYQAAEWAYMHYESTGMTGEAAQADKRAQAWRRFATAPDIYEEDE